MDKSKRDVYDSIESGEYSSPVCAYGIVGVSDAVEESIINSFDRFSSFSELSNLEFYGNDVFKFIYEGEEFYGSIKTINNNSSDLIPMTFFSEEDMAKIFNVGTIILLQISMGKDILQSYRLHFKLCKVLVPSLVAIQDLFLGTEYSREYVNVVIDYDGFLNPTKIININQVEIDGRSMLKTTGLIRFGMFDLALEVKDEESVDSLYSELIVTAVRLLIYRIMSPKIYSELHIMEGKTLVFEPLEDYFERRGETYSYAENVEFEDYYPVVTISKLVDGSIADIDVTDSEHMTLIEIPMEVERRRKNAHTFLPFLEYLFVELDANAKVMMNIRDKREDKEVACWFEVSEIFEDYITADVIDVGGLSSLEAGENLTIKKSDIVDWKAELSSNIFTPEEAYLSYENTADSVNPIIIHNKDTLLEQIEVWKSEGKYDEIKEVLVDKIPLEYDEKIILLDTLIKLNQYDEAVFLAATIYFEANRDYVYFKLLAELMIKNFKFKAAFLLVEKAVSLNEDSIDLSILKAQCLYNLSRHTEAEKLLKDIKEEVAKGVSIPSYKSELIDDIFNDVLKRKYKKSAEDLIPKLNLLYFNARYSEVVKTVEEKYDGDNKNVIVLYIKSLIKLKRFKRAKSELEKIESVANNDTDWNEMIAEVLFELGEKEESKKYADRVSELEEWYRKNKYEFVEETYRDMQNDNKCVFFNYYPNDNSFLIFFDFNNPRIKDDIIKQSTDDKRLYKKTLEQFIINYYTNSGKKKIEHVSVVEHSIIVVDLKDSYIWGKDLLEYLIEKTMSLRDVIQSGKFTELFSEFGSDLDYYIIDLSKSYDMSSKEGFALVEDMLYDLTRLGYIAEAKALIENQEPIKSVVDSIKRQTILDSKYMNPLYDNHHILYLTILTFDANKYYFEICSYIVQFMKGDISSYLKKSLIEFAVYAEVSYDVINSQKLDALLEEANRFDIRFHDSFNPAVSVYKSAKESAVDDTLEKFFLFHIVKDNYKGMYHYLLENYDYISYEDDFLNLLDDLISVKDSSESEKVLRIVSKLGYRDEDVVSAIMIDKLILTKQYEKAKDYINNCRQYDIDDIVNLCYIGIKMGNYYMIKKHAETIYNGVNISAFGEGFKTDRVFLTYLYSLCYVGDYSKLKHLLVFVSKDSPDYKKLLQRLYRGASERLLKKEEQDYKQFLDMIEVKEVDRYFC